MITSAPKRNRKCRNRLRGFGICRCPHGQGQSELTPENFVAAIRRLYPNDAYKVLEVYSPKTSDEVLDAAMALASARFAP